MSDGKPSTGRRANSVASVGDKPASARGTSSRRKAAPKAPKPVVLVTGVGRYLGARVAARLAGDPAIGRVIGIDANPLAEVDMVGVELHEAQLRTGELLKLFGTADITAVVHLAVATAPDGQRGGRAAMKESNVIGTM